MWTDVFIRRPVLALVISLLLVLLGSVSVGRLGVQETPPVDAPTITATTIWLGADPAIVETEVTEILERELNGIEGLELIRSESRDQVSQVTLEFGLGRDLEAAANDVRDRVSRARGLLPDDVDEPVVEKTDAAAQPVIYLRLLGDRSLLDLTDIADRLVRERLQSIAGVSGVQFFGERRYAMRVELDLARMAAHGVTVPDLQAALLAQNVDAPAGRVEGDAMDLSLRVDAGLETPEDFSRLVVAEHDGAQVRLGDVAFVRLGAEDERSSARSDGVPSVTLTVVPQSGANIVDISDAVRERLARIRQVLPEGVQVDINYDRSLPVRAGIRDVAFTLLLSTLVVVVILWLFLRDLRATLIPTAAIVVSITGTFAFFEAVGFTINVFTLFGLVLAIGIVVDDAIVVLENIWRRLELGEAPVDAALHGTREIVFPVVATTLSLLAVFLPVVFAGGTSGRLFLEFGSTIAVSVLLSMIAALTLTPMLSATLLRPRTQHVAPGGGVLQATFDATLRPVMARPWVSWVLVAASLVGGIWALQSAPREFFPLEDRNFFLVQAKAPEGIGFAWMDARMGELEQELMALVPERLGLITRVSFARGNTPGATNSGIYGFPLVPPEDRERSQGEIVKAVAPFLAGITAFRAIPIQFPTVGRGFGTPVQLAVLFDDFDELVEKLPLVEDAARQTPGLSGVDVDLKLNRPEVSVVVDRDKAAALGVSVRDVARTLQVLSSGLELSRFKLRARQYDVLVGLAPQDRATTEQLARLLVRAKSGALVPLDNLVRFVERSATSSRFHVDRAAAVTVNANLDGIALGEGLDRLQAALRASLGDTVRLEPLGQSRELVEASGQLGLVFALAVALVFLVLAAQFDSLRDPLPILVSLPVAIAAGVGALVLAGQSLTFFAQVGLVLLVGLVTKNGILIVEFARHVQAEEGVDVLEAARRAAVLRLRPILMTATTVVGGAIPIAIGWSGASREALGIVVCAGMTAATALSLYVTPVVWAGIASLRWRRGAKTAATALVAAMLAPRADAAPLDLAGALQQAARTSPALRAAREDAEAARRAVGTARGALLPSVGATSRFQYGNTFVAGGGQVGGSATPYMSVVGQLTVPVLDAGALGGLASVSRRADASAATADAVALDVQRQVAEATVGLQAATAKLSVVRDSVARSESLLALAEDRVAVGVGTPLDATRARLQLRQDQLQVVNVERDVAAARALLAALLGLPDEPPETAPLAELPRPTGEGGAIPAVEAAQSIVVATAAEARQGRYLFVPRLSGFGTAGAITRFQEGWIPTLSAGVDFSWTPIGPAALADLRRLASAHAAAVARADLAQATATAASTTADAELRAAGAALALAREALALAEAELDQARDAYASGAADNAAVILAQGRRAQLAAGLVDALASWDRAVVRWHVSRGTLAPVGG